MFIIEKYQMMKQEKWRDISVREKWQIINGTVLILSAIILYFIAFALTLTIGMGVVSACSSMLATGLAFFGITGYIKNQMIHFEANVNEKMKEIERRYDTDGGRTTEVEETDKV